MSAPGKFPSGEVLRRLGMLNPAGLYGMSGAPLQGTVQVLDLSRSVASEPVEARAISYNNVAGGPGAYGIGALQSRSPGGLLVERVSILAPTLAPFPSTQVFFAVLAASPFTGVPSAAAKVDVGGIATRSLVTRASQATPFAPQMQFGKAFESYSIFVPPGSFLAFQVLVDPLEMFVAWRELQEPAQ